MSDQLPVTDGTIIQERKKRIFSVKTVLFLCLSIVMIFFLVRQLDFEKTLDIVKQSDFRLMILAVFLYFTVNFLKSLRYRILFSDTGLGALFTISSYHNFFNMILPARTGELTFIYYAKKISGIEITKGLHVLLVVRVFDFIVISMIFITSLLVYYGSAVSPLLLALGIGFFIISVAVLLNLKFLIKFMHYAFTSLTAWIGISEKRIIRKLNDKLALLVEEFYGFKTRKYVPLLTATSCLVWFVLYVMFYVIILSFGVDIDPLRSVIGSTGGVLTNVLPINSFGSFGTLEAGWTGGFVLVGMPEQEAIVTGFGSHLIELVSCAVLALACAMSAKISAGRKKS